jgi:serine/threonine protein kinase
MKLAF